MKIYALGQDPYWLSAIKHIEVQNSRIEIIRCAGGLLECLGDLPSANAKSLILLDVSDLNDIATLLHRLRRQGWRYIVVLATDQSAKQAISVLRGNLAYDYWEKSYDATRLKAKIEGLLSEITVDLRN